MIIKQSPLKKDFKALDVALFFINKCSENEQKINNKKLQKLVYYAQAWNLAINGKKLFTANIEAWVN